MDKTIEFLKLSSKIKKTPEEIHKKVIEYTKSVFYGKKLFLEKINSETSWGREHCEYCFKDLNEGDRAYTDEEKKYWLCQECFEKHKDELNLKTDY